MTINTFNCKLNHCRIIYFMWKIHVFYYVYIPLCDEITASISEDQRGTDQNDYLSMK